MASSLEYVRYVCDQLEGVGSISLRRMFGEYCVYVNSRPILFICDDVPYIKPLPEIAELMQGCELALPWKAATREWYIVDIDNSQLLNKVVKTLVGLTPLPKPRQKRISQFATEVYNAVRTIPYGKVATYKQIATMVGNPKAVRAVGTVLHNNPNWQDIPCHRVVNINGKLASGFAFGGISKQRDRLQTEGVQVAVDRVDLHKFGWQNDQI